jgi:putative FmdB family regulatory protein
MPTYEYECTGCGYRFDKFQSIKDPPLKRCPKCRRKVRRLLGAGAGIIFKGSGFYTTDYRSKSYKDKAKADQGSSATAKPAAESKPAAASKPATGGTSK